MNFGLPLMKNVLTPLAKCVLVTLGITPVAWVTDAAIKNKILGSGTILIISDEEKDDIMQIFNFLKNSGLLIKNISKTLKNEAREQKMKLLAMLLSTLGASLLGNMSASKRVLRGGEGVIGASEWTNRAGQDY